jgi:cytochrome c553
MARRVLTAFVAGAALSAPAAFAQPPQAANAVAQSCAPCHGERGISHVDEIPSLAAQPDAFLQWQLVYFRSGTRKNEAMQPIAEQLELEEIRNMAAYFAALPPSAPAADDDPALARRGRQLAGAHRCSSCHLENYAGTGAVARLAGQREDYLRKALADFKAGRRAGSGGAAMAQVAYELSVDDIAALAHYLAVLP